MTLYLVTKPPFDYNGIKERFCRFKDAVGEDNGDSKTNSSDALNILKVATGFKTVDYKQHKLAVVNFDTKSNSSDALQILKYATGIIDSFEKPAA